MRKEEMETCEDLHLVLDFCPVFLDRSHCEWLTCLGGIALPPKAVRFLLGSANLSSSAFSDSVEAGIISEDRAGLGRLKLWFDNLFRTHSSEFTPESLRRMEIKWRAAAVARAHARLRGRGAMVVPVTAEDEPLAAEDLDTLEDVFATFQLPIGLLDMDYARNNIRNVERVRTVLSEWADVAIGKDARAKQRSELKLLGFAKGSNLTPLGEAAAVSASAEEIARLWCAWVQNTSEEELASVNIKLLVAKRVFTQFWKLQEDVRSYFLVYAENPSEETRPILQIIELLCNASDVVQEFSLEDIKTLAPLLEQQERLPAFVRDAVLEYKENKGTRSWNSPDRKIVPLAWKATMP
jgi:hypothetical protein